MIKGAYVTNLFDYNFSNEFGEELEHKSTFRGEIAAGNSRALREVALGFFSFNKMQIFMLGKH